MVVLRVSAFFGLLTGCNLYKSVTVLLRLPAFFGHLDGGRISIEMAENKAEACGRNTTCFYVTVYNYIAAVGICMVTCPTVSNMSNF